ncbi:leucyl/phenylalanyl-tRNA--protein transferase [Defluviimonas sp. WL0050]|uniref:Leucyl/phenylalanyl-tRNA--protein transferase n=1 Tax=Albidovulum litorale TaxID=2984134 RepID=A0ABT2ZJ90_9RHOB|nr:leucyl/phenylalanyl-tRNA--protein transferase [Defluviimonas sp. WL0050]MCV2870811.1 leucyl/phenylalanyl-tRNA--protein transferase [Defluviimonas sp. WL0050]
MLTPEVMLSGYAHGIFPMADGRDSEDLHWVDPRLRGVIPLDGFHVSRSLRRAILRKDYSIRIDSAFSAVIRACADREETWINAPLFDLYDRLHDMGHAHSLEVWQQGELTGGVFGITLGAAYFGESMFSRRTNASKIALAYLVDRLRQGGFTLFDTQFLTPHLSSLGGIEIPRAEYRARLADALEREADYCAVSDPSAEGMLQRMTQTS